MTKDLSVIIVNYNVRHYLQQALHSVTRALRDINAEILVVDNGSGDGSVQMVRKEFPGVILIQNKDNPGFAKANNQAMHMAKGRAIALVNPDTLVREDTFQVCLDFLDAHDDVGMAGCKILNPDGSLQLACRRSFPSPWVAFTRIAGLNALFPKSRTFGRYNLTYLDPDQQADVEAVSGSFMVVKREVVDRVGGLDEQFFMYGEDLDWCYRIHKAGYRIVYLPQTQIIHYKGQSTLEAPFDSLRVFNKAMLLFVRKHMQPGLYLIPQWMLIIGIWIRSAVTLCASVIARNIAPILDFILLSAGMILSVLIRFSPEGRTSDYLVRYRYIIPVYAAVWLVCLALSGLFRRKSYSISRTISGVFAGFIINTSLTFFFPQFAYSRQVILMSGAAGLVFLTAWRFMVQFLPNLDKVPFLKKAALFLVKKKVVVAGTGPASNEIVNRLRRRIKTRVAVTGQLAVHEDEFENRDSCAAPVLGTVQEVNRLAKVYGIDEIIVPPEVLSYKQLLAVVAHTREFDLDVKLVPKDMDVLIGRGNIEAIDELTLVDVEYRIFLFHNRMLKRLFDITAAVLLLPASLAVRIIVRLNPSFSTREAVFTYPNRRQTIQLVVRNEEKVQGIIGTLFNIVYILKGSMTVVGIEPDPQIVREVAWCKPGLITLCDVSEGARMDKEERLRYYFYYIKNYSFLFDLEIVAKSFLP